MSVNQTEILTSFSYLIGESSVPSTGTEDRKAFIQEALSDAYRMFPFELSKTVASIPLTNGIGTLSTDTLQDSSLDVRYERSGVDDDDIFSRIDYEDKDGYGAGDFKYWLTGYAGNYTINTTEPSVSAVTVRYTLNAPTINASVSTPFPSAMVIAQGAIPYWRQARDPEYDISQDRAVFEQGVERIWTQQQRSKAPRRFKSKQERFDLGSV